MNCVFRATATSYFGHGGVRFVWGRAWYWLLGR